MSLQPESVVSPSETNGPAAGEVPGANNDAVLTTGVREGYTFVVVDFDKDQELKAKYGVATQHNFVQVDEIGEPKTKFTVR